MSTLRQQFARKVVVNTAASPSVTEVDIFGPESALAPPYAENTDHVVEPRQVRQNEAGWVVVDGWSASALAVDDQTVDIEIWRRGSNAAQRGLDAPLFPSGAAAAADPSLKRVVASGLLGAADTALIESMLGGSLGGVDNKDVPALHLRADEFVKIRLTATAGAALGPVTLSAKFDLGGNPGDTHRLA
jgi:hypothetical protein